MTREQATKEGIELGFEGSDLDFYVALAIGKLDGDIMESQGPDEEVEEE
jgi:hypothetical protein